VQQRRKWKADMKAKIQVLGKKLDAKYGKEWRDGGEGRESEEFKERYKLRDKGFDYEGDFIEPEEEKRSRDFFGGGGSGPAGGEGIFSALIEGLLMGIGF
jgi:hypothetical protein